MRQVFPNLGRVESAGTKFTSLRDFEDVVGFQVTRENGVLGTLEYLYECTYLFGDEEIVEVEEFPDVQTDLWPLFCSRYRELKKIRAGNLEALAWPE